MPWMVSGSHLASFRCEFHAHVHVCRCLRRMYSGMHLRPVLARVWRFFGPAARRHRKADTSRWASCSCV